LKTVFLKPRFEGIPLHSLYDVLIQNPPQNYKIIIPNFTKPRKLTHFASKSNNLVHRMLVHYLGGLPYVLTQSMRSLKEYDKFDLIYASQHVLTTEKPWVVDFEFANALAAYSDLTLCKNIISKKLKSKSCKGVLPFSNWAADTLRKSIDCKDFNEKIRVLRPTVAPKKISKIKKNRSSIRILFVGSSNPATLHDFEFKGLYETVEAFIALQKKYDNLELVIRSKVSTEIKEKTKKYSNIKIIERILTPSELDQLYLSSDISPHAGFLNLNAAIFEAMSYGIPVIATSLYNISELIKDMKNGILIKPPNPSLFYTKNGCPSDFSMTFVHSMKKLRPYMVEKLKEAMTILIEDTSLREKLSREATKPFESGEFSIKKRQEILKDVFDEATK